jgi:WD40 repeat protein
MSFEHPQEYNGDSSRSNSDDSDSDKSETMDGMRGLLYSCGKSTLARVLLALCEDGTVNPEKMEGMVNHSQLHQHERDRCAFMVVSEQVRLGNDEMRIILGYLSSTYSERNRWSAHTDAVKYCRYSSDDHTTIVSSSDDKTCKVWQATTSGQQLTNTLQGNSELLGCFTINEDRTVLVGSVGMALKLWDTTTGDIERVLDGHQDWVQSVCFSPNQDMILTGSCDNTMKLWDVSTGCMKRTFAGHDAGVNTVCFSPDGGTLLSGSVDTTLRMYDAVSGQLQCVFEGHAGPVNCSGFSPDGNTIISGSADSTVKLWQVVENSGRRLRKILAGHRGIVLCVCFSPCGKSIASGCYGGMLRLWNAATGQLQHTLDDNVAVAVWSCAFHPGGDTVLSGHDDGTVVRWGRRAEEFLVASGKSRGPD